jgi:Na+-translocating ferredoxin:NAD+ oxidoreductase RnfC subunit
LTDEQRNAGHDEDEEKVKIGTPLERVLLMANAMLDAIKTFKSPDGKNLRIRIGMPLSDLSTISSVGMMFLS